MSIRLHETDQLLTLTYHHITDRAAGLVRRPHELRDDIVILQQEGYTFFTATDAVASHKANSLPQKAALITFDDGLSTQWENAVPILEELGIPATFFIISSTLEGKVPPVILLQKLLSHLGSERMYEILEQRLPAVFKELLKDTYIPLHMQFKAPEPDDIRPIKFVMNNLMPPQLTADIVSQIADEHLGDLTEAELASQLFMRSDHLKWLQDNGHEVGAHTVIHPLLYFLSQDQIVYELATSQQQIELHTNGKPQSFAFPFGGHFSDTIVSLVSQYYTSGWNYLIDGPSTYLRNIILKNIFDIPRLEASSFMAQRQ